MTNGEDATSATSLLRGIAETARAHGDVWDVARLAEMLELYGLYLRERADGRGAPVAPALGFGDFVVDETLVGEWRARRNAAR